MSKTRDVVYHCPYCGKPFDVQVYESIDAHQDQDLRDRAVSGDLFRLSCPHCYHEFMVQYPLVYIDTDHKFVLWLSEEAPSQELLTITKPLLEKGFRLRRCETLSEFVEKIQIFEDGMDDIMVELARYDCFIEFINNKKGEVEDITSIEYQTCQDGVMKINVRTNDKGMAFMIPISMMEEEMKDGKDFYSVDEASFPLVNAAWMIQKFENLANQLEEKEKQS